jgi:hypothetical protein
LAGAALGTGHIHSGLRDARPLPTEPSSRSTLANVELSELRGAVLGPDGRNVCQTVTGQTFIVHAIPQSFELPFPAEVVLTCPENRYSFQVEPGEYRLRAEFFTYENLGNLPVSWILPPVTVGGGELTRNIRFDEGTPLGGRVTIDGEPFAGLPIFAIHEFFFGFAPGGRSDQNGRWEDAFPVDIPEITRSPFILQNNVEYAVVGPCDFVLGTRIVETSFDQPFVFPSQSRRVDCELSTDVARRLTHTRNRIGVTAFPGDIGGLTAQVGVRDPDIGTGIGVQFPITPRQLPRPSLDLSIPQLFTGGLMIGVGPATVLTGIEIGGYMECRFDLENGCRDLGLDARGEVTRLANGGRVITWRYSDAPSGEGVGLRVIQRSFDAPQGETYVLFRFAIRNGSNGRLNINPGIFTDFDLDSLFEDEVSHRQRGGRLISQTDVDDPHGTRVGTLMIGESDPAPGYFILGSGPDFDFLTIPQQIAALRGNRTNSGDGPDDQRYIQSVRAIGLSPGAETDLWVAVIAAENDAAFAAAADAATRDIRERRQRLLAGAAEPSGEVEWSYTAPATARTTAAREPRCGKECMHKLKGGRFPAGSQAPAALQYQRWSRE